jgi:hypothetical protein
VDDYTPIVIDVPNAIYENLGVVEVSADEEVKQ